jgi:hypothetical protein
MQNVVEEFIRGKYIFLCIYIYIYVHVYIHICAYTCTYIYRERETKIIKLENKAEENNQHKAGGDKEILEHSHVKVKDVTI